MADVDIRSNTALEMRRGIILMIAASVTIPMLDASAKLLTERHGLSAGEVALARFLLQTAMALPLILAFHGSAGLKIRQPSLNLLRGVLLAIATACFFLSLKLMPLADATAIFFVQPVVVTVLSALFLKEKIGPARIVAVLVGFLGTLIVIRPNFLALGPVAALPMLAAVFVALYAILNRRLAGTGTPLAMHLYSGIGGSLFLMPILLAGHAAGIPDLALALPSGAVVYGLLALIGLVATAAHLMFIQAYHDAPASLLAPLGYLEVPSAMLIGILVFGHLPDIVTLGGIAIIVASGLALVLRRQGEAVPVPPAP